MDSAYLKQHVGKALSLGLSEICQKKPADPIDYLSNWLRKHVENLSDQAKEEAVFEQLEKDRLEAEEEKRRQEALLEEQEQIAKEILKRDMENFDQEESAEKVKAAEIPADVFVKIQTEEIQPEDVDGEETNQHTTGNLNEIQNGTRGLTDENSNENEQNVSIDANIDLHSRNNGGDTIADAPKDDLPPTTSHDNKLDEVSKDDSPHATTSDNKIDEATKDDELLTEQDNGTPTSDDAKTIEDQTAATVQMNKNIEARQSPNIEHTAQGNVTQQNGEQEIIDQDADDNVLADSLDDI